LQSWPVSRRNSVGSKEKKEKKKNLQVSIGGDVEKKIRENKAHSLNAERRDSGVRNSRSKLNHFGHTLPEGQHFESQRL
jgi:hypothetical protein